MTQDIDLHLGKRLRARRLAMGYTLEALAAACGMTFQMISKYESAASRMSARQIWILSRALEVDANYFYNGLDRGLEATPPINGVRKPDRL